MYRIEPNYRIVRDGRVVLATTSQHTAQRLAATSRVLSGVVEVFAFGQWSPLTDPEPTPPASSALLVPGGLGSVA